MKPDFIIEEINGKKVVLGGVGRMFYQDGFPISMAVSELRKQGLEVSILHVADECIKNGWSGKTAYNKIKADFIDDIDKNPLDDELLRTFCHTNYKEQRKIIFNYLFSSREEAKQWLCQSKKIQN